MKDDGLICSGVRQGNGFWPEICHRFKFEIRHSKAKISAVYCSFIVKITYFGHAARGQRMSHLDFGESDIPAAKVEMETCPGYTGLRKYASI